ncbi:ABC transporter permease [Dictyobacter arantiisoli]|uniref:ABC transporter permease n=1 Tax=Dictyobacter arantiisoli TaxID=2014874 RepID=A0A5A5TBT2_9CHLR|nr:ABC transporter permease subunit [Dictyobacter arantiisoli]GCF08882.1 hypothetical protein KDI_24460 [Dictyobacter arantiisoli]
MFIALLIKEMRLRMRRERTIWLIVAYILLLGLLGWMYISLINTNSNNGASWGSIGSGLYTILLIVQLFLILFITPAFTATAINGEKERQTFDLLLCSRLSSTSLIIGKLLAGLINALLLIAASIPIFSLVFFFGGVSPLQAAGALLLSVLTAIFIASLGICCSTLVARPALSTAITYMLILLWLGLPLLLAIIAPSTLNRTVTISGNTPTLQPPIYFIWHPIIAILNTYNPVTLTQSSQYTWGAISLSYWETYSILTVITTAVFLLISIWRVKPRSSRLYRRLRSQPKSKLSGSNSQETPASATA